MKMIKVFVAVLLVWFSSSCAYQDKIYSYKVGDLLFQDLDCGDFCAAIEKVTYGVEGKDFSHVAMVYSLADTVKVIEAVGEGVVITPIETFLARSKDANGNPKVVVGRLKSRYANLTDAAMRISRTKLGASYDEVFSIDNDRYYCSELIYYAFQSNDGKSLFELEPMTYKDPETHKLFPIWERYFKQLGVEVPEGEPGLNPGSISRSNKIDIVKSFY